MAFDQSALVQVFDPVPDDIVAYFDYIDDGSLSSLFEFELNLLPVSRAIGLTAQFRQFHPIVRALNGFVLDDGNTSDHHVYLAAAPLMGAILFLSHDRDSRVVYPSLNDFLRAAETTKNVGRRFSEIHPLHSPVPSNQAALSEFVLRQLDIGGATEAIAA